jgi:hypothetical protein
LLKALLKVQEKTETPKSLKELKQEFGLEK